MCHLRSTCTCVVTMIVDNFVAFGRLTMCQIQERFLGMYIAQRFVWTGEGFFS